MTLGEYIFQYMESHALSQRQFALQCGVTNGYVSMLISGVNPRTGKPLRPTLDTYVKLADGMGIPLNDLFKAVDDTPVSLSTDDAIWQKRESLRRDPKRRVLFDLAENGTEKDIDAAIKLLDALKATNPNFYDGDDPA